MNLQPSNIKLEKLKDTWYHASPSRLYDLCVETIIKNLELLLVKNDETKCVTKLAKKTDIESSNQKHENENDAKCSSIFKNEKGSKSSKISKQELLKPKLKKSQNRYCHCRQDKTSPKTQKPSHSDCKRFFSSTHNKKDRYLKYRLRDNIGTIPNCISQSIIVEYSKYYLKLLEIHERNQYFYIESKKMAQSSSSSSSQSTVAAAASPLLINYYDLLMAFATRSQNFKLNVIDYRQCIWSHSTLEERIKTKQKSKHLGNNTAEVESNELDLKSLRSRQTTHLLDLDLRLIVKNQKDLHHLDTCPCMLTNKSILLINKYLNKSLKSLRFQNCCNWQLKNNTEQHQQPQENDRTPNLVALRDQQANVNPQMNDFDNDRLELRNFIDTEEEEEDDDDDDDDDDEDDNDVIINVPQTRATAGVHLSDDENDEELNDLFNLQPYFLNNSVNAQTSASGVNEEFKG
jgi:hypothetical protein